MSLFKKKEKDKQLDRCVAVINQYRSLLKLIESQSNPNINGNTSYYTFRITNIELRMRLNRMNKTLEGVYDDDL